MRQLCFSFRPPYITHSFMGFCSYFSVCTCKIACSIHFVLISVRYIKSKHFYHQNIVSIYRFVPNQATLILIPPDSVQSNMSISRFGLLFFTIVCCSRLTNVEVPLCLKKIIRHPLLLVQIDAFRYRGEIVFLGLSRCCDIPEVLLNSTCKAICSPAGGFSGHGDGRCLNFYETTKQLGNIWTAPRG